MIGNFLPNLTEAEQNAIDYYLSNQAKDHASNPQQQLSGSISLDNVINAVLQHETFTLDAELGSNISQIKLKKLLLFCSVLQTVVTDGKVQLLTTILNSVIREARKNEFFYILKDALVMKRNLSAFRSPFNEWETISKDLDKVAATAAKYEHASQTVNFIINNSKFTTQLCDPELIAKLTQDLELIEQDLDETNSEMIRYHFYRIKLHKLELEGRYCECSALCYQIGQLVKKHQFLYTRERFGNTRQNLALYKILSGRYLQATKILTKNSEYFIPNSYNSYCNVELTFRSHFLQGNFDQAQLALQDMKFFNIENIGPFSRAMEEYYMGCLHFMRKEFKAARQVLGRKLLLETDRPKRNIFLRVLSIMTLVELDDLLKASLAVDALRKFISRNTDTNVGARIKTIIAAILELEKVNFEYYEKNKEIFTLWQKLKSKDKEYVWIRSSPELVPFHVWLRSRRR